MAELEDAIREQYGEIEDLRPVLAASKFLEGDVYYAEFKGADGEEDFFYAFKTNNNIHLYDDGVSVIKEFQSLLDRRRSILQRLNEFGLFDLVAAATTAIFALVFAGRLALGETLDKDFVALFTLLIGYLFGKKTPGAE